MDIITSLSMHPYVNSIELNRNLLGTKGCMALATLLRCSLTKLEWIHLDGNEINDEDLDALVPVFQHCGHLRNLSLDNNLAVSSKGWQRLATILQAPDSNLTSLSIAGNNNVDDEVVTALMRALKNNHKLKALGIDDCPSITDNGWTVFSKLLSDTSNINSTFLSNHTLKYVTSMDNVNSGTARAALQPLLRLNQREDKKEVAIIKMLKHHNDFDMMPFFMWEFKVLPLMISWFERALSITAVRRGYETNIGQRKLSSIYQFVRGMPVEYVEARLKKELEDIKAEGQLETKH